MDDEIKDGMKQAAEDSQHYPGRTGKELKRTLRNKNWTEKKREYF